MARGIVDKATSLLKIERLGRYRIVRPLSKGGMALVFEARRESLAGVAPRVAIKVILPEHAQSETFRDLFKNEARLGANMHHQNLVQIQDFDQVDDLFFLVMEYVEGITLRQIVSLCARASVPIPLGVIAEIGRQACDGLHYAHQATDERGVHLGLIHRDVKPSNLMLSPHGVIKILDFGISKGNLIAERTGAVRGTWGYMAPEQAAGREIGPNADVFGLATILYELASRQPLFRKKKPDEIKRLLSDDHAARMAATLPAEYRPLISVLVRALQRDPAARYASAAEFGRALSALLPDPITARDEVVRFFSAIEALDQGRPLPAGALRVSGGVAIPGPGVDGAPSQGSIVAPPPPTTHRRTGLWLIAAVVALLLVGGLGAGVGVWLRQSESSSGPSALLDFDDVGGVGDMVIRDLPDRASPSRPEPDRAPAARPPPERPAAASQTEGHDERSEPAGASADVDASESGDRAERGGDSAPPEALTEQPEPVEEPVTVRVDRRRPELQIVEVDPDAASEVDAGARADASASEDLPTEGVVESTPEPEPAGVGFVTLSAQPYGLEYDVFINGKLVNKGGGTAPVIRHELPAGQHFVTISAAGGARKQFQLEIDGDEHVRKVWDFERNAWRR